MTPPDLTPSDEAYQLKAETLVTQLVQRENERLTRLLRNLYQEFRLGQADRSKLYENICRELAQYFHCDCCQLYLLRPERSQEEDGTCDVTETLVLVAAFGAWEQALKPRYVRRIFQTQYGLNFSSHTASRFLRAEPTADLCRRNYRKGRGRRRREGAEKGAKNAEWHLVWRRDNLYSVSRNMLSCPILRHRSKGQRIRPHSGIAKSKERGKPYPVGLIKLENRRPLLNHAFESNYPASKHYLGSYFGLCSVAAYVNDLRKRAGLAENENALFSPLHDADGWRQHYQEHDSGQPYFEAVREWQSMQREQCNSQNTKRKLSKKRGLNFKQVKERICHHYREVGSILSDIMDLVVEVEVLLQELTIASLAISSQRDATTVGKGRAAGTFAQRLAKLTEGAPAPSFFNVLGLVKSGEDASWVLDAIHEAIRHECPSANLTVKPDLVCRQLVDVLAGVIADDPAEGGPDDGSLMVRLRAVFRDRNDKWIGLLTKDNRDGVAKWLCRFLKDIATRIRERRGRDKTSVLTHAVAAAYQSANVVLKVLMEGEGKPEVDSVELLARASASACMYAHTFDPQLDRARLFSVQSHVAQVLDNDLMDRARLSGLGITFDHVELLGLTENAIGELERLGKLLHDVESCLVSAIEREAMRKESKTWWTVESRNETVANLLENIAASLLDDKLRPIDLARVMIRPKPEWRIRDLPAVEKLLRLSKSRSKDRVKLKVSFEGKDILCLQLIVPEATMQAPRIEGAEVPTDRPGLMWLFALNETLATCRFELRGFDEPFRRYENGE